MKLIKDETVPKLIEYLDLYKNAVNVLHGAIAGSEQDIEPDEKEHMDGVLKEVDAIIAELENADPVPTPNQFVKDLLAFLEAESGDRAPIPTEHACESLCILRACLREDIPFIEYGRIIASGKDAVKPVMIGETEYVIVLSVRKRDEKVQYEGEWRGLVTGEIATTDTGSCIPIFHDERGEIRMFSRDLHETTSLEDLAEDQP